MSLNTEIIQALKPLAPIALHSYTGSAETYITFFTFNQRAGLVADDTEKTTVYSIQIDIYSKGNIEDLAAKVRKALQGLGFKRTTEMDLFEITTKTYRKNMSFTTSRDTE